MKDVLAFRLIADQLEWTDAQLVDEMKELQLLIDHKYDHYQGYQPGARFHIALMNWLSQFPAVSDRQVAYRFVKDRLIFVSQREMHHLVSLLMPLVERAHRHKVCAELGLPFYKTWLDSAAKNRLKLLQRRTLFVGLSDGARVDVFRRYNEGIVNNEQVVATNEFNEDKWADLQKELRNDLDKAGFSKEQAKFEWVVLLDDFSGSGTSLLRKDPDGHWKAKVARFIAANVAPTLRSELMSGCCLQIHHHLASNKAKADIERNMADFSASVGGLTYQVSFSHHLPARIVIGDSDPDTDLVRLIKQLYDPAIEDKHTKKDIWFGYKECGLPLILEHNTPNNSVALLWASSPADSSATHKMKALFARRKRHSSYE
jgi:hypothetical protein